MNDKLREIVLRLERQGYRFDFDDDTPDEDVESILDIVFCDYRDDDEEDVCDACGTHLTSSAAARSSGS